jgi:hypothetical protein
MLAPREETPPKAEGKLSSCNRLFINRLQPIPVLGSIATHGPIPMLFEQLPQSSMVPNDALLGLTRPIDGGAFTCIQSETDHRLYQA